MNNTYRSAILGWLIAGVIGFIANSAWLVMITKGNFSGMSLEVSYIFLICYALGHFCIFLPIFLILWKNSTSRFWSFRYMLPIGFLVSAAAFPLIKGESILEPHMIIWSLRLGLYGFMIAGSCVIAFKIANKPRHDNPS
jgi:hypothetical protein